MLVAANRNILSKLVLALLLGLLAVSASAKKPDLPDVDAFGLERVKGAKVQALYIDPEADFSHFKRVAIVEPEVAFRKNWLRDTNQYRKSPGSRVTEEDAKNIKSAVASLFEEVFKKELQDAGYVVVEGQISGADLDDLLILRPAILNLDVNAPDKFSAGRSRTFTTSAGSMTLYLEFHEAVSGALIGRALDSKSAPDNSFMTVTNSVTNRADATRLLRRWADMLVQALGKARAEGKPPS